MAGETLSGKGIAGRFVAAALLVYTTWNPLGWSFFDWAVRPLFGGAATAGPAALKFLAAVVLAAGWAVYLQATKRSLGLGGVALVVAVCGGIVWLLYSLNALNGASGQPSTSSGSNWLIQRNAGWSLRRSIGSIEL